MTVPVLLSDSKRWEQARSRVQATVTLGDVLGKLKDSKKKTNNPRRQLEAYHSTDRTEGNELRQEQHKDWTKETRLPIS